MNYCTVLSIHIIQKKCFSAFNLSASECCHFGLLFEKEEQEKVGLWCTAHFYHKCWHCLWFVLGKRRAEKGWLVMYFIQMLAFFMTPLIQAAECTVAMLTVVFLQPSNDSLYWTGQEMEWKAAVCIFSILFRSIGLALLLWISSTLQLHFWPTIQMKFQLQLLSTSILWIWNLLIITLFWKCNLQMILPSNCTCANHNHMRKLKGYFQPTLKVKWRADQANQQQRTSLSVDQQQRTSLSVDQQQRTSLSVSLQRCSLQQQDACGINKDIKVRWWLEHSHGFAIKDLSNVVTIGVLQTEVSQFDLERVGSTLIILIQESDGRISSRQRFQPGRNRVWYLMRRDHLSFKTTFV